MRRRLIPTSPGAAWQKARARDVHLGNVLAAARVRGFQGEDLAAEDALCATPKHLTGYGAVMASFTDVNGIPATANRALLTGALRGEPGFAGPCVSDYAADREFVAHGAAADEADAAARAILAGTDMSMQSGLYVAHLHALGASGRVPIARVDKAVRRVLVPKERLGLFDRPFRSLDPAAERVRAGAPGEDATMSGGANSRAAITVPPA